MGDASTESLLMTATGGMRRERGVAIDQRESVKVVGRRNITRIPVQQGIIGRCARKKQIFKLDRIVSSPFVSESADGVDVHKMGEVNMMVGPLLAHMGDDDTRVMGVLQLVDKKRASENCPTVSGTASAKSRCD